MSPWYVVRVNSDQTEGRGPMVDGGWFKDLEAAVAQARREHFGADIDEVHLRQDDEWEDGSGYGPIVREQIWGYREDRKGRFSQGFLDLRDEPDPTKDPEYAEFLRLREKFDGQ